MTSPDTNDIMGRATKRVEAAARRSSQAKPWEDLVSRLALALNCLPSSFVDENDHLFKAIDKLKANAARAESLASADEGAPVVAYTKDGEGGHAPILTFDASRFLDRDSFKALVLQSDHLAALSAQSTAADEMAVVLRGYMAAVERMNAAMEDGINVHGAISGLVGWTDNAQAALAAHEAKSGGKG